MMSVTPSSEKMGEAVMRTCTPFGRVRNEPSTLGMTKKKIKQNQVKSCPESKTKKPLKAELSKILQDLKSIVISLERRPDRMEGCSARLQLHCPWLQHEYFRASDGRQDVIGQNEVTNRWHTGKNVVYQKIRSVRKGWDDLDTYVVRELDQSAGERGCSSSHIRAWRHCLETCGPNEPLLVLEDDAAPTKDFTAVLERALKVLPQDAHVLYLGYSQAADWKREVSAELVESEYVWTTVAYMIWPEGARVLLNRLPIDQPVDNWMATSCAEGVLKSYCVRPKIIHQADAWNVNSDVGHSDELVGGPCSDIRHSDHLYGGPDDCLDIRASEEQLEQNVEIAGEQRETVFFGADLDGSDSDDNMD